MPAPIATPRWTATAACSSCSSSPITSARDSYFDQIGNPSPLRHAWTLPVEEQFYVVIPFLILAICALTRSRRLRFTLVMALACLSA